MIRSSVILLSFLLLAAAPVQASAQDVPVSTVTSQDDYSLQPGDLVRIAIWREPDLSGEFVVDVDGTVTLPLLGEQQVAGMEVGELRGQLVERYRGQLRNPSISITPLRRVNVLGSVQRPGVYAVDPTTTLAGLIAQAGGANVDGTLDRIRILRGGQVIRERVGQAETLAAANIRSSDQVFVDRRSWLDRNSGTLLSAAVTVGTSLISTLIIVSSQNGGG
jgi:protein involved in polysaccharide export with SLBB domain